MTTRLRPLLKTDLPFAHHLSRAAGWNQTAADWRRFLDLGEGGCFLAEHEGESAGTATTICYGTDLAWIGMVRASRIGAGLKVVAKTRESFGSLHDDAIATSSYLRLKSFIR